MYFLPLRDCQAIWTCCPTTAGERGGVGWRITSCCYIRTGRIWKRTWPRCPCVGVRSSPGSTPNTRLLLGCWGMDRKWLCWRWELSSICSSLCWWVIRADVNLCVRVCVCQASSSESMGRWLGVLLAETGSTTDPATLHYDYIDVETTANVIQLAKQSFWWGAELCPKFLHLIYYIIHQLHRLYSIIHTLYM